MSRTEYAIMNPSLSAYSYNTYSKHEAFEVYEHYRKYHIKKGTTCYGYLLVERPAKLSGFKVILRVNNAYTYWKPRLEWKYDRRFQWLWFNFQFEPVYKNINVKILKDNLAEHNLISV